MSGKTTLLKHIYRALPLEKKTIFINGTELEKFSYRDSARQITIFPILLLATQQPGAKAITQQHYDNHPQGRPHSLFMKNWAVVSSPRILVSTGGLRLP